MKKFLSISLLLWVVGASFADTTMLNYHKLSAASVGALRVPKVNIKAATLLEAVLQLQKLLDEKYPGLPPMKINFTDMGEIKPLEESIDLRLENICVYLILRSFCDLVGCNVEIDEDSFKFVRGVPATEMIEIKMKRYVFDKQSEVVIGLKLDERPPNMEEVKGFCKKAFDLEIVRLGFAGDLVLVDMRGEPAGHERLAVAIVSFIDGKLKEHYGVK